MSGCHCRRHTDIDDDVSDIIGSAAAQAAIAGIVDYQETASQQASWRAALLGRLHMGPSSEFISRIPPADSYREQRDA